MIKNKGGRPPNKRAFVRTRSKLRRWQKILRFQADAGEMTYVELMDKYNVCRETVRKWKNIEVPIEMIEKLTSRESEAQDKKNDRRIRKLEAADIGVIEFVEHPKYLNTPLYPMQKIILKAFYGIQMDSEELKIIDQLRVEGKTNWDPNGRYNELVLDCGMKSGKTVLASVISCIEEFNLWKLGDACKHYGFTPGSEIYIVNIATNADQARDTIFAETKAKIANSPFYKSRNPYSTDKEIVFEGNIKMRSGHSNSASLVGKKGPLVLFDEIARFQNSQGKSSADAVYESLTRNVTPFKDDGKIVSISSPIEIDDKITRLFKQCFEIDSMLGFHLSTWEVNPNLPLDCRFLQNELKKNPEAFWRDYGAQPSQSLEAYYRDPERIPKMFKQGSQRKMVNPINHDGSFKDGFIGMTEFDYYLHLDPAVNNCGFGIGLSHRIGDRVIIDLAHRFRVLKGEIDFDRVKEFLLLLLQRFPTIKKVSYDSYLAISLAQPLKAKGLEAVFLNVSKEVQDVLKEQIYIGNVETYPNKILDNEIRGLELVSGKKVDHKKKGTKDIVDGVAGSVWHCMKEEILIAACGGSDGEATYEDTGQIDPYFNRRSMI